jgi:hypothetical protein
MAAAALPTVQVVAQSGKTVLSRIEWTEKKTSGRGGYPSTTMVKFVAWSVSHYPRAGSSDPGGFTHEFATKKAALAVYEATVAACGPPKRAGRAAGGYGTPGHDDAERPEPGHDFVVLKHRTVRKGFLHFVLLAKRLKDHTGRRFEYVTWISSDRFGRGDREWGHYFGLDYERALEDYETRE